jgi:hypothetical protein
MHTGHTREELTLGHHPNQRSRGYFQAASGAVCYLREPESSDIRITDIALALSRIPRFGAHCAPVVRHYSVAQHSCLVARLLRDQPRQVQFAGLMHDSDEAYLGDVISPLKALLGPEYKGLERAWSHAIAAKFDVLPWWEYPQVKDADCLALELERHDLTVQGPGFFWWGRPAKPEEYRNTCILPLDQDAAYKTFLRLYCELST